MAIVCTLVNVMCVVVSGREVKRNHQRLSRQGETQLDNKLYHHQHCLTATSEQCRERITTLQEEHEKLATQYTVKHKDLMHCMSREAALVADEEEEEQEKAAARSAHDAGRADDHILRLKRREVIRDCVVYIKQTYSEYFG